jgi:membrane associated rhomboid family serine protease
MVIYFISGIAGCLFSSLVQPGSLSVGASGAIMVHFSISAFLAFLSIFVSFVSFVSCVSFLSFLFFVSFLFIMSLGINGRQSGRSIMEKGKIRSNAT